MEMEKRKILMGFRNGVMPVFTLIAKDSNVKKWRRGDFLYRKIDDGHVSIPAWANKKEAEMFLEKNSQILAHRIYETYQIDLNNYLKLYPKNERKSIVFEFL